MSRGVAEEGKEARLWNKSSLSLARIVVGEERSKKKPG